MARTLEAPAPLAAVRPIDGERFADLEALFAAKGCSFARGCWCMDYRLSGRLEPPAGTAVAEAKKAMMRDLAEGDRAPGLLGYDRDGSPAGWVTAGPRTDFRRLARSPVTKPVDDVPVWSVVCFVVPAERRGQGIGHALLAAAVAFAEEHGAPAVEGYPHDRGGRSRPEFLWHGVRSMFARAGFREIARRKEGRPVMRLDLAAHGEGKG